MNAASVLFAASAAILGMLGCIHALYTYRGNKLDPRDPAVREAMERVNPVITRQTTVWRATKGFNASHSLGLVAFALVYGYLALRRSEVLGGSNFLLTLGMAVQLTYLALARRYFFSVPFRGMALACALYASGWALV
ncbi:MAG: hypothetical protein KGI67_10610 [Pseudomonadota bacterium]|nr:hypothetical protein [Pseudomonadota bacterium]